MCNFYGICCCTTWLSVTLCIGDTVQGLGLTGCVGGYIQIITAFLDEIQFVSNYDFCFPFLPYFSSFDYISLLVISSRQTVQVNW